MPLASLGQDPEPFELRHAPEDAARGAQGPSYVYRFERETSGTTEALRGVIMARGRPPLVVGDRGTALVRDRKGGWFREATGTEEDLYALAFAPRVEPGGTVEEATKRADVVVVGSRGTALVRSSAGVWRAEQSGTSADLFALFYRGKSTVAVGAGGAMVERTPEGVWRSIASHTTADLYAIGPCASHLCAVGAEGAMVDCVARGDSLACVPRPPLTSGALRATEGTVHIMGDGVWLGYKAPEKREPEPPPTFAPWPFMAGMMEGESVRSAATNHWIGIGEMVAVGAGSTLFFVGNTFLKKKPVEKVRLPFEVDFHGVVYDLVDGFLVGDRGTLVRLGVHGFTPPKICLL